MTLLIIGKYNTKGKRNSYRGKFSLEYKQQHLNDNQCISLSILNFMT